MEQFPNEFVPLQQDNFEKLFDEYALSKLREEVYVHVLCNGRDKTKYFDLDDYNKKYVNDMKKTRQFTSQIMEELRKLGWSVATSYGRTGLFVYSGDRPVNLWPDE